MSRPAGGRRCALRSQSSNYDFAMNLADLDRRTLTWPRASSTEVLSRATRARKPPRITPLSDAYSPASTLNRTMSAISLGSVMLSCRVERMPRPWDSVPSYRILPPDVRAAGSAATRGERVRVRSFTAAVPWDRLSECTPARVKTCSSGCSSSVTAAIGEADISSGLRLTLGGQVVCELLRLDVSWQPRGERAARSMVRL